MQFVVTFEYGEVPKHLDTATIIKQSILMKWCRYIGTLCLL